MVWTLNSGHSIIFRCHYGPCCLCLLVWLASDWLCRRPVEGRSWLYTHKLVPWLAVIFRQMVPVPPALPSPVNRRCRRRCHEAVSVVNFDPRWMADHVLHSQLAEQGLCLLGRRRDCRFMAVPRLIGEVCRLMAAGRQNSAAAVVLQGRLWVPRLPPLLQYKSPSRTPSRVSLCGIAKKLKSVAAIVKLHLKGCFTVLRFVKLSSGL